jgi:hypothetical protein
MIIRYKSAVEAAAAAAAAAHQQPTTATDASCGRGIISHAADDDRCLILDALRVVLVHVRQTLVAVALAYWLLLPPLRRVMRRHHCLQHRRQ